MIRYINLADEVLSGDLRNVLARITAEVEQSAASLVVVDSFRSLRESPAAQFGGEVITASGDGAAAPSRMPLEQFIQELAVFLTGWEVTALVIGEYGELEQREPLFIIADGILWLTQATDFNSVVRKLQVVKVRGQAQMPGLHTFRITADGLHVYPRIPEQQSGQQRIARSRHRERLSTAVPGLDAMMGGRHSIRRRRHGRRPDRDRQNDLRHAVRRRGTAAG